MERVFARHVDELQELRQESEQLQLSFAPQTSGTLVLRLQEEVRLLDLTIHAEDDSEICVFLDIRCAHELKLTQRVHAGRDAQVKIGILDQEEAAADYDLHAELDRSGARVEIHTATLVSADKKWRMEIVHAHPHTYGYMENFCVVKDDARCQVEAIGSIRKGAYGSESHQKTRILTMSAHHHAEAVPVLCIDEHDVKASHAMTLGQPDEEQLYYLQTRGLSKEQALGLLSVGYFMPVADLLAHSEMHAQIQYRVEEKVGLYDHRSSTR